MFLLAEENLLVLLTEGCLYIQYIFAAGQEILDIIVCVEAHEVTVQYPSDNFLTSGQHIIDLTCWKWGVQREPYLRLFPTLRELMTKHLRYQCQVIVMYPYKTSIWGRVGDGYCKT